MGVVTPPFHPSFGVGAPGGSVPVNQPYYDVTAPSAPVPYIYYSGAWRIAGSAGGSNATQLQGVNISATTPSNLQVLQYQTGSSEWVPATISAGGGPPSSEYFSFANSGPSAFTIQSDFLTVDSSNSMGSWTSILSNGSKNTGKVYWEGHFLTVNNYWVIGMAKSTFTSGNLLDFLGNNSNTWGIDSAGNAHVGGGGSSSGSVPSFTSGDVIGVAIDFGGGTIAFYKNGTLGNIITVSLAATTLYLGLSAGSGGNIRRARLATTAAQCTFSPPATYSNWN